jgi:hypothetical protein
MQQGKDTVTIGPSYGGLWVAIQLSLITTQNFFKVRMMSRGEALIGSCQLTYGRLDSLKETAQCLNVITDQNRIP